VIVAAIGLSAIAGGMPALGQQQVYTYNVVHPFYGEIGTLTDTITSSPATSSPATSSPAATRSDWRLRVAVKLLGIVVYRQDSDTTVIMLGNRLVSLQSVTEKDGRRSEVHGEVSGDRFVVNATGGSFTGPASIAPSDPWALRRSGDWTMVYMDTGRMIDVRVSGGEDAMISVNGAFVSARHFIVTGDKRQEVWLDSRKTPIMFRTVEDGTPILFVLQVAGPR
jgi:hypothetical protein